MELDQTYTPKLKTMFGLKVSAIFETFLFTAIILILDWLFWGGERFVGSTQNPLWVVILLIASKYGIREGIFSVVVCSFALYFYNIPQMEFNETLFHYRLRLILIPSLWFVAAFVLGQMRTNLEEDAEHYKALAEEKEDETSRIADNYEILKEKKERIEVKLATEMRSIGVTYRALEHLTARNPHDVLLSMSRIVNEILGPKKFSTFKIEGDQLKLLESSGWGPQDHYKENFSSSDPLYQTLVSNKKVLCIVNLKHEKILDKEGLIAVPIHDRRTGMVSGMLKIEEIDFGELNLSTIELCEALGEIVGKAYAYSLVFQDLLNNQLHSMRDERVYSSHLYKLHQDLFENTGVLELVIRPKDDLRTTRNQLFSNVQSILQKGELLYENEKGPHQYRVLVPSITKKRQQELGLALDQLNIQHQWISS